MVKRKIVPIILSVTLLSVIFGNMLVSNATDNNLKTFEEEKTVEMNQIEEYKETLEQEISKDGITYKLEDIIEHRRGIETSTPIRNKIRCSYPTLRIKRFSHMTGHHQTEERVQNRYSTLRMIMPPCELQPDIS